MNIGFIGVGVMGHGMAANLLGHGHRLTVLGHRNRVPVDDLVKRGAQEARDHAELAAGSDVIILCVSSADVVETVVAALKPHLEAGQIIIDTSTSRPDLSRRLAGELRDIGVSWAEAPLTGGAQQAEAGELGAIVGADRDVFETIKPVLQCFCSRMALFGPPGAGHEAKLINNYLVFGMVALIAETYNLARLKNIDWSDLYEVMKSGSNYSEALKRIVGGALEGDYDRYRFSIDGALKDMTYFMDLLATSGLDSETAKAVMAMFDDAAASGLGGHNVSRLIDPDIDSLKKTET